MFLKSKSLLHNAKSQGKLLKFKRNCILKLFTSFESSLETIQTKIDRQSQEFQVFISNNIGKLSKYKKSGEYFKLSYNENS
jgi:hypothetical protein